MQGNLGLHLLATFSLLSDVSSRTLRIVFRTKGVERRSFFLSSPSLAPTRGNPITSNGTFPQSHLGQRLPPLYLCRARCNGIKLGETREGIRGRKDGRNKEEVAERKWRERAMEMSEGGGTWRYRGTTYRHSRVDQRLFNHWRQRRGHRKEPLIRWLEKKNQIFFLFLLKMVIGSLRRTEGAFTFATSLLFAVTVASVASYLSSRPPAPYPTSRDRQMCTANHLEPDR